MRQLGGDFGGQSRNAIIKLGGAGFKLLKIKLNFQVHKLGFWGTFEKQQNLDGIGVDFFIYCAVGHGAAARKLDSNRLQK